MDLNAGDVIVNLKINADDIRTIVARVVEEAR